MNYVIKDIYRELLLIDIKFCNSKVKSIRYNNGRSVIFIKEDSFYKQDHFYLKYGIFR